MILIVEDDDSDYELLMRLFRRSNILNPTHRVETIRDAICYLKGEGRFADRQQFPFPLLMLLNMRLPDGTGFDALRWLRQHPELAPRALVVLTGMEPNAIRKAYSEGASTFLSKPLKLADFKNMAEAVRGIRLRALEGGHVLEPV